MKRLKEFLMKKSNWVSFFTFVLAFIAFCLSFFIREFSYQIIALMFCLIAVENFIKHFVFMDGIKDKLNGLIEKDPKGVKVKRIFNFTREIDDFLVKSQQEFIMIGGSMSKFAGSIDLIIRHARDNDVKVRILALNIENEEIKAQYKKMIKFEHAPSDLSHLKELKNQKNIEIRTYESLPTAYYFAVDLNSEGNIWAAHILYGVTYETDYPNILVDASDKYWYEVYRQQIEKLWNEGTPWS